jgi:hypothetical protein
VRLGGTGIDLVTELLYEVEHIMPDYNLYNCNYSMGFSQRDCPRGCPFCVVKKKEGEAHPVADIYEFWDRRHKKIVLFDNNILALPEHFEKIAGQLIKEKLRVDWNQGLDIRLISDENAEILRKVKLWPHPRFAFDDIKSEASVRRGIEILREHGIKRSVFTVLIGFNSTFEEDLRKVNILRELGQRPFVMIYNNHMELYKNSMDYQYLRKWCNARMVFATQDFDTYVKNQKNGIAKMLTKKGKKKKEIEGKLEENVFKFKV